MVIVHPSARGTLKQALLKVGWPAEDLAGYVNGAALEIDLAQDGWTLRSYQREAVEHFEAGVLGVNQVLVQRPGGDPPPLRRTDWL
jgi:DNA excision repair protein ERCC-3